MIRRFYIMPLNYGIQQSHIDEMIDGMNASDLFLEGLTQSCAALDFDSPTIIWENNLADEQMYTGPYMHHPYHAGTLDDYLMGDSPQCYTHDTFTVRYIADEAPSQLTTAIRRLVLLSVPEDADLTLLEELAATQPHMDSSVLRPDNVGWVSAKGRAWSHIWEQTFADRDSLERYLQSREGQACSSVEKLKRIGVPLNAMKIFTYSFDLRHKQQAEPLQELAFPAYYSITARLDNADADTYIDLLRTLYDPYVSDAGGKLAHRFRTVESGYPWLEVQSIWEIESVAAYHQFRMKTGADPRWGQFVSNAMPLVKGGSRRFSRAL